MCDHLIMRMVLAVVIFFTTVVLFAPVFCLTEITESVGKPVKDRTRCDGLALGWIGDAPDLIEWGLAFAGGATLAAVVVLWRPRAGVVRP